MFYAAFSIEDRYSHGLERDRLVNSLKVQLVLLMTLIFRWELEHHALAMIVDDSEGVPCYIHPLGHRLLVVLLV